MKIGIIGAGIFGCAIAEELSKNKRYKIDLYDENNFVLNNTSLVNQCRLHSGYHYPRSLQTMLECQENRDLFKDRYSKFVTSKADQYYAIAKENSFLTTEEAEHNWTEAGLLVKEAETNLINKDKIDKIYITEEELYDPYNLKIYFLNLLNNAKNVDLLLGQSFDFNTTDDYDYVINCTYNRYNDIAIAKGLPTRPIQLELIEKMIVFTPDSLQNFSLVVMDGPFMCIDPVPTSQTLSMLGNVEKAIHQKYIRLRTPKTRFDEYIGAGYICSHDIPEDKTRHNEILAHGAEFIPDLKYSLWMYSMYTWRAVLPNREHDDARPTIIKQHGNILNIFSGKFSACVDTANKVRDIIK